MIIVSNTAAQTLAPGQTMTFTTAIWKSGCGESFRPNSGIVRLSGGCYEVKFHANIGGTVAATPVQLAISLSGVVLPETTMISTPAALTDLNNVSAETIVGIAQRCSSATITVTNNGTSTVVVGANPALEIVRRG